MKSRMLGQLTGWALTVALCAPLALNAQEDGPPPPLADVWVVHVKQGHGAEFEAQFKAHLAVREEAKDPRAWQVYSPVVGDDMAHYGIRFCCTDWAGQDAYDAWSLQAASVQEHWNDNVHPHVESYQHYLQVIDYENGHWPDEDPGFKFFGVTRWDIKPGGYAAMEKARVEMSTLAKEHGWPRYWSWVNPVGGSGGLELVSPFVNYAGMAPPEQGFAAFIGAQVGAEKAAELLSAFGSNLTHGNYTIYREREDLSPSSE